MVAFGGVERPAGFPHAELFGPLVATEARGHRLGTRLLEASVERARAARSGRRCTARWGPATRPGRSSSSGRAFTRRAVRRRRSSWSPARTGPRRKSRRAWSCAAPARTTCPRRSSSTASASRPARFPDAVWRENVATGTVYAAEDEGRLVAVLNIDPSDRWIYHVGVTTSERNRGVGSYLLSRSLADYWEQHPNQALGLDVDADNVPAIRLYRRQGFAPWLVLQTFELKL